METKLPVYVETRMATPADFPAILALRQEYLGDLPWYVSQIEEEDISSNSHLVAVVSSGNKVVASGRLDKVADGYRITRVVTTSTMQRMGLGKKVLNTLLSISQQDEPGVIRLKARLGAKYFYENYGFQPIGPEYFENNIAYINMIKND